MCETDAVVNIWRNTTNHIVTSNCVSNTVIRYQRTNNNVKTCPSNWSDSNILSIATYANSFTDNFIFLAYYERHGDYTTGLDLYLTFSLLISLMSGKSFYLEGSCCFKAIANNFPIIWQQLEINNFTNVAKPIWI